MKVELSLFLTNEALCHEGGVEIQVRQVNFLFHTAFHIQKRKLACRTRITAKSLA
jgi:hypothetical protein